MGKVIMLVRVFVLKVIKNGRKVLTHYEIIDCKAEQTESVITEVCEDSQSCGFISSELATPKFLITFSI